VSSIPEITPRTISISTHSFPNRWLQMAKKFVSKASSSSSSSSQNLRHQRHFLTQQRFAAQQHQQQQHRWRQPMAFPHSSSESSINRMCQSMANVNLTPNGGGQASEIWPAQHQTCANRLGSQQNGSVTMFRTKVIYHSGGTPASSGEAAAQYQQQLQQNRLRLIPQQQQQLQLQQPQPEEAAV